MNIDRSWARGAEALRVRRKVWRFVSAHANYTKLYTRDVTRSDRSGIGAAAAERRFRFPGAGPAAVVADRRARDRG